VRLTLTYRHPQTRRHVRIDEIVRVPQPDSFTLRVGERGEVLCWGFLQNGRLRHPVWTKDLPGSRTCLASVSRTVSRWGMSTINFELVRVEVRTGRRRRATQWDS
jgi:alpha-tubulin suppressor-like RCC1 family protein